MSERRTPRTSARTRRPGKAALLAPDVTHVDYKDVTLLRTFVSDRGKVRARRITGVTPRQQRLITKAVKNAREMALLPYSSR